MTLCVCLVRSNRAFPEGAWRHFLGLEMIGDDDGLFQDVTRKFMMSSEEWSRWYQSSCPEDEPLPADFAGAGAGQKLCILRALRPDRFTFALKKFVTASLGQDFASRPAFSMESIYELASASIPILFLLTPGVDPVAWLENFGRERDVTETNGMLSSLLMGEKEQLKYLEKSEQGSLSPRWNDRRAKSPGSNWCCDVWLMGW